MKKLYATTIAFWVILVVLWFFFYVNNRIHSPDATPGYETTWSFQCVMFLIFRLPISIVLLSLILFVENKLWKRTK